jgi:hypothetical protein
MHGETVKFAVFSFFFIFLQFMQHVYAMILVSHSFKCEQHFVFCDSRICALIVQTQENTGKCTILQYKVFTIEALEIGCFPPLHVGRPQAAFINVCVKHSL